MVLAQGKPLDEAGSLGLEVHVHNSFLVLGLLCARLNSYLRDTRARGTLLRDAPAAMATYLYAAYSTYTLSQTAPAYCRYATKPTYCSFITV